MLKCVLPIKKLLLHYNKKVVFSAMTMSARHHHHHHQVIYSVPIIQTQVDRRLIKRYSEHVH